MAIDAGAMQVRIQLGFGAGGVMLLEVRGERVSDDGERHEFTLHDRIVVGAQDDDRLQS